MSNSTCFSSKKHLLRMVLFVLIGVFFYSCTPSVREETRLLVFSKTEGFRHGSIPAGQQALKKLAKKNQFQVDLTEDATIFTEENLAQYSAVIFLNTTGDVLNTKQEAAFERYIQAGGGFVGIHSATDTEYQWPWYGKLVGAYFNDHPHHQKADILVTDKDHPSTSFLPSPWNIYEEWYNFKDINSSINILLTVDESTYEGGIHPDNHPISWYQQYDGGRMFYTGLGHMDETFEDELFLKHLEAGIAYAIGSNQTLNYTNAYSQLPPDETRFTKTVLTQNLNEPMEFEILPDGQILIIEREGDIKLLNETSGAIKTIQHMDVALEAESADDDVELEDGLLGLALDPNFEQNNWLYLFYSSLEGDPKQHISRFTYQDGKLDMASEKILLQIPVQRKTCCHSAGSIEFGPDGNLYIATGDNTNPFESNGFGPIDERPGRSPFDAQKSSANPNDLRGKVLRIKPQPDGTYTIPEGNLFPEGTAGTRPEIYVMGCRNPFRISIDQRTGFLYWGDVGPDAGNNEEDRGSRGYDEVNQARKAGFFGWPYFIGNNQPYHDYNFVTRASGSPFDPEAPENDSPNNTGIQSLPPAQPAFIWYPYARSTEFPLMGAGGRNAMAGPVYYADAYSAGDGKFPDYYHEKLFVYDWIRGWIRAVSMDEAGDITKIEPFAEHLDWHNPIDMQFSRNGVLYVLEYGKSWYTQNLDARLSRVDFVDGNRPPVAEASASPLAGKAPLTVQFTADQSMDPDGDDLSYNWSFSDGQQATDANPSITFEEEGTYTGELTVRDRGGSKSTAEISFQVGNSIPEIDWTVKFANTTFYWNAPLEYEVQVSDAEDGSTQSGQITAKDILVNIGYMAEGEDLSAVAQGHEFFMNQQAGAKLVETYNCTACHQVDTGIVGPSYLDVARRYKSDPKAPDMLITKIQNGGTGTWGDRAMPANPQVTDVEAQKIIRYIMALEDTEPEAKRLPLKGTFSPKEVAFGGEEEEEFEFDPDNAEGIFFLSATYTDKGNGAIPGFTQTKSLTLRPARILAAFFDDASSFVKPWEPEEDEEEDFEGVLDNCRNGAWLKFENLDLSGVKEVQCGYVDTEVGGSIEIRLGSPEGKQIGTIETAGTDWGNYAESAAAIASTEGIHDIFFVFRNVEDPDEPVCMPDYFYFSNRSLLAQK